jgi:hypothetical protein
MPTESQLHEDTLRARIRQKVHDGALPLGTLADGVRRASVQWREVSTGGDAPALPRRDMRLALVESCLEAAEVAGR